MPLEPKAAALALAELLSLVKKLDRGAEARATMWSARTANTRFARNEVTTAGEADESQVALSLALGRRHASVASNQTEPAALQALAARALALARVAPEDPEYMPVLGPQRAPPAAAGAFDDGAAALTAQARAEAARVCIETAKSRGLVIAGFVEHAAGTLAVASNAGLSLQQKVSGVDLSVTARTPDGLGSGWASSSTRGAKALDAARLSAAACEKAALSRAPKRLEPGRYTVLLEPAATSELLGWLWGALDARAADEGRSYFSKAGGGTRLGEALLSPHVTLVSNPALAAAPGVTFDDEGLPLTPLTWVDAGTLKALHTSRFWAQKTGRAPTGGYRGVSLREGSQSLEQLLAGIEKGVLITRFWYSNWVDPQSLAVTGLTRDGTFLIEGGALAGAVSNFRFNESVANVFSKCDPPSSQAVCVGPPESRCPALRTHEFNLASVSDAV